MPTVPPTQNVVPLFDDDRGDEPFVPAAPDRHPMGVLVAVGFFGTVGALGVSCLVGAVTIVRWLWRAA